MFKKFTLIGAISVIFIGASPLMAEEAGGLNIGGDATAIGIQGNVAAIAVGDGTNAQNRAGEISGNTSIRGDATAIGIQDNAAAIAVGDGTSASNCAGVISSKPCGTQ